jgi:gamma-glutamyltranspeptidase/glutathione hydrolase
MDRKRIKISLLRRIFTLLGGEGRRNQWGVLFAFTLLLAGCGEFDITDPFGSIERATGAAPPKPVGLYGALAGDEPSAVLVGNNVLAGGGSAADAAVAMGFVLSVTLPSRASLGGGGVCLVNDPRTGAVAALDFIPPASGQRGGKIDRPSAVPTLVRGMAALHARYGRLPWGRLLMPADQLARSGHAVTALFAADLARLARPLFADPEARSVFADRNGAPLGVGDDLLQLDLRTVLAQIRVRGAGEFYSGRLAQRLLDAVPAAGGSLDADNLRRYLPKWRAPLSVAIGEDVVHVAPLPASVGAVAAKMLQLMAVDDRFSRISAAERPHLLVEAAKRAYRERASWLGGGSTDDVFSVAAARRLMSGYQAGRASSARDFGTATPPPDNPATTGFVVVDGEGMAVACTFTMYRLFGTGRMVPGLGIMLAAAPDGRERNPYSLGPLIVTRAGDGALRFAAAGSGGSAAASAMAAVAARAMFGGSSLMEAMKAPRVHHAGAPDVAVVEDAAATVAADLARRGHRVERRATAARVDAVYCPHGLPDTRGRRGSCEAANDPRGAGLAAIMDRQ